MRVFEKPNLIGGWKCPICGKDDEKQVALINIYGKEEDGICEAEQFHLDCIDLWYYKKEDNGGIKNMLNMGWGI